jgi:hypothetical protein
MASYEGEIWGGHQLRDVGVIDGAGGAGDGPGDGVVCRGPFIASIVGVYAQGIPVLAEIDRTFNLDPEDVRANHAERKRSWWCT